jgi:hypothetical protein
VHPFHKAQRAVRLGRLSSRALRGRLPPGLVPTPRTMRGRGVPHHGAWDDLGALGL